MKCLLSIILTVALFSKGAVLFAQSSPSYLVQKVVIKGLPQNILYTSLLQDKKGFLWIGTLNGLYRYNGLRVDKFLNNPGDTLSLSHNYVNCLEQDNRGNIWIGTYGGGINKFDFYQSATQRINAETLGKEQLIISRIVPSMKGAHLWIATPKMVQNFSPDKQVTKSFTIPFINPRNRIRDIIETKENLLLAASAQGLYMIDAQKNIVSELVPGNIVSGNKNENGYYSFAKDISGDIWIGGNNGLTILDGITLKPKFPIASIVETALKKDTVIKIFRDQDQQYWIATTNKLLLYNTVTKTIYKQGSFFLNITDIAQDKQGNIWITTQKDGLYRIVKPSVDFHTLTGLDVFSRGGIISQVTEETDSTWLIATEYFLVRYNLRSGILEKIDIGTQTLKPGVTSIYFDSKKNLWVGTQAEGVFCKPGGSNIFSPISFVMKENNAAPFYQVTSFREDNFGTLWAGVFAMNVNQSGLFYYSPIQKKMIQQIARPNNKKFLAPLAISQIERGEGNELWTGTWNGGVFKISPTDSNLLIQNNLTIQSPTKSRITLNIVSCIFVDKQGALWLGTVGGGLNVYYPKKDSVHYFTVAEGLPSNLIYKIEQDNNNQLWMSTDNGISRYDKKNNNFTNYNLTSGLSVSNFSFLSSLKSSNGTLAFGTNDGNLIYFDPSTLRQEINDLPTIITDIRISNKSVFSSGNGLIKKAAYLTDTLVLNHDQNVIGFELANMDMSEPDKFTYAYKLEGFDKEWNTISDYNSFTYTNLDPGKYTLLLKNANHLGQWNETPTKLILIIEPPYWLTWWFISLIILAVASVLYAFFRYRLGQKLRVLQIRNRLHRDLHDDVGATLSSVKAYSEILKEDPNNLVIAGLIRDNSTDMLERLEVIAWATNPQHDYFKSLKSMMIKFATPLCHAKKIECNIGSSGVNEETLMPGELRQNIFLIFKEAINNMIKYADATACNTQMAISNNLFVLQIKDNGKGFDGLTKGTGNGWKNMYKRTADLNGKLVIESVPEKGTKIIMTIPYPFKIPSSWDTRQHRD